MRRFKTKRNYKRQIGIFLIIIVMMIFFLLSYYNQKISPKVLNIATSKLEEITTLYIKKDITPQNANLDRLIKTSKNDKGEILMVDVDMDYAYELMLATIKKIQNNIMRLESADISDFVNSKELKSYKGNLYLDIPLGLAHDGLLFSNIGPNVPIKLSFFEHVLGTVESNITGYGINSALLKVYLTITLEQKLIIPYKEESFIRDFELLLGSKVISGKVPTIYGGAINKTSPIIDTQ